MLLLTLPRSSGEAEGGVMGWGLQLLFTLRDQGHLGPSQWASRAWGPGPPPSGGGRPSPRGAGLGLPSHRREPSKAQIKNGQELRGYSGKAVTQQSCQIVLLRANIVLNVWICHLSLNKNMLLPSYVFILAGCGQLRTIWWPWFSEYPIKHPVDLGGYF